MAIDTAVIAGAALVVSLISTVISVLSYRETRTSRQAAGQAAAARFAGLITSKMVFSAPTEERPLAGVHNSVMELRGPLGEAMTMLPREKLKIARSILDANSTLNTVLFPLIHTEAGKRPISDAPDALEAYRAWLAQMRVHIEAMTR